MSPEFDQSIPRRSLFPFLAAELYELILSHVPSENLKQTILSLTRVSPHLPIAQEHLFHDITLERAEQVIQLNRRLRSDAEAAGWVRHFALNAWNADADVLVRSAMTSLPHHFLRRIPS